MADDPSTLIVPFGKHQGLTVAELVVRDPAYVEWLLGQSWLAQRFAKLHEAIITRGAAPDDTPEHNQIQARFLDPTFRAAVIDITRDLTDAQNRDYLKRRREPTRLRDACIDNIQRINKIIDAGSKYYYQDELLQKQQDLAKYQALVDAVTPLPIDSDVEFEHEGIDVLIRWGFEYSDEYKITVEIKPSLGDDYPSVMRQMSRLGARVLVIDQYNSATLNLSTVREMFKANGQTLVTLQEIFDQIPNAKIFMGNSA